MSGRLSHIVHCTVLSVAMLMVWFTGEVHGQIIVTPASTDCACDGALSFNAGTAGNVYFAWYDVNGGLIAQEVSPTGESQIGSLCPGVYSVEVNSGNGAETFVANVPGVTNPGSATTDTLCNSEGNVNLSSLLPDFTPGGFWSNELGQAVSDSQNTSLLSGTNTFFYTLNTGTCEVSTVLELTIAENASAGLSTTYLICENYVPFHMTDVLTGDPSATGTWLDINGNVISGWYDPASMNGGLFTYMVSEVAYCSPSFSSLFIIENAIGNPGDDSMLTLCSNGTPVEMFSLISGSPEPGGYWLNELGQPVDGIYDPAVEPAGVYTYVLPGETPCPAQSSSVEIEVTLFSPAGEDGFLELCANAPLFELGDMLGGSPLTGGTWLAPGGQVVPEQLDPSVSGSGQYAYIVQDQDCPHDTAYVSIIIDALPEAGPDQAMTWCGGIELDLNSLTSNVNSSGLWFLENTAISNPGSYIAPEGQSTLTFVAPSANSFCPADTAIIQLTGETPLPVLADQEHEVCISISSIDLNLLTGFPAATQWSTGDSELTLNASEVVTIEAWVQSFNSCPDETAIIQIEAFDEAFPEESLLLELCYSGGNTDLYAVSGMSPDTGIWLTTGGNELPNGVLTANPAGSYMLVSGIPHVCGADTLVVEIQSSVALSAGEDLEWVTCQDVAPIAWTNLFQLSDPFSVVFGDVPAGNSFDPSAMPGGAYFAITESNGPCPSDTASAQITVLPAMSFNAGPDLELCEGPGAIELGQPAEEGCTYQWIPSLNLNNNLVSNPEFSPEEVADSPWTQEYVVVVSNAYCTTSDTLSITILPGAAATIEAPATACTGDWVQAQADGNLITWEWSVNGEPVSTGQEIELSVNEDTELFVSGENEWGCASASSAWIMVSEYPAALISNLPPPSCAPISIGLVAELTGNQNAEVNWYIGGQFAGTGMELNTEWYPVGEQTLTVMLENAAGCITEIEVDGGIVVFPAPEAEIVASSLEAGIFQPEVELENQSIGADSLLWTLPDGQHSGEDTFTYTIPSFDSQSLSFILEVWNEFGCSDIDQVTVLVVNDQVFYAPNAFSPDNDGLNEIFRPVFYGYDKESYILSIFDRWGVEIFRTTDPEEGWKGNYQGGDHYVQSDVYTWKAQLKVQGTAQYDTFSGTITIVR